MTVPERATAGEGAPDIAGLAARAREELDALPPISQPSWYRRHATPSPPEASPDNRESAPSADDHTGREALAAVHDLKVWPPYFDALADGSKPFEVRRDDRQFRVGDVLRLREWDLHPGTAQEIEAKGYTGREVTLRVTYVLAGLAAHQFGVAQGYCVLGLAALSRSPEPEGWEGMPPPQHEQPLYPHNDLSSTCCPGCLWTALVGARGLLADANAEIDRVAADRNEYAALLKEAALAALSRSPERATAGEGRLVAQALARRLAIAKNDLHDETCRADALALQVRDLQARLAVSHSSHSTPVGNNEKPSAALPAPAAAPAVPGVGDAPDGDLRRRTSHGRSDGGLR